MISKKILSKIIDMKILSWFPIHSKTLKVNYLFVTLPIKYFNINLNFADSDEKLDNKNVFEKFSFDTDDFTSAKKTYGSDGNNNLDPFGPTKNESVLGFDFANFDSFNDNGTTNGNTKPTKGAWDGSLDKKNNNVRKYSEQEVKKINKFSTDYSENFDTDLQEILKRSVMEQ